MFSLRLKELRETKGLSQRELAAQLGVSQGTVGNWESATREPNFETVKKLSDFFGVSANSILGIEVSSLPNDPTDTEIKFALFNGHEDITDEMYDEVKNFAEMVMLREAAKKKNENK